MIEPIDLHAYVDGELQPAEQANLQKRLNESPNSVREVEAIRNLKTLLAEKSVETTSSQAWKACVRRLDEVDKARRVETVVGRFAPAMCSIFFVAILLGGLVSRHHEAGGSTSRNLTAMIGRMHFDKSQSSSDRDQWLKKLIDNSKFSTPDHLQIRQVEECDLDGMIVRRVIVRDSNGDITVLLIPRPIEFEGFSNMPGHPEFKYGQCWGRNCIARPDGETTTVITAERPYEELASVLSHLAIK